jgi:C-terminal processing protease CtpA/Prc
MIGSLFDHDLKFQDVKRRKETKPIIAKTRGQESFKGQLIVLIDSFSGSSAEILARVVQLEKRGVVIGDQSAGAVMRSERFDYEMGANAVLAYAASITDADVIMSDGKSLEHTGVTPDELLLPTGADLAAKRDPVLSRAAELAGMKIDPEKAGAMFPIEWKRN